MRVNKPVQRDLVKEGLMSQEAIGRVLGISRSAVNKIEKQALRKLAASGKVKKLKEYLYK